MKRHESAGVSTLFIALLLVGLLTACASNGGSSDAEAKKDVPPPASSPLSKVELGSNDAQVRNIMGNPDNSNSYQTGKSWIPYYWGPDTHRSDWFYKGQGRVVFSRNRYSGQLKVIRVMYNPDDTFD
jgi:hypothetical protein